MWIVKEQTKQTPMGKQVSPIMEAQSGAELCRDLLQKQADANRKPDDDPKHYYVVQAIKRGTKVYKPA